MGVPLSQKFLIYDTVLRLTPFATQIASASLQTPANSRKLLRKQWCVEASLRGYCTVKLFAVVVIPPALVTAIGPDVAPAGTVASMK